MNGESRDVSRMWRLRGLSAPAALLLTLIALGSSYADDQHYPVTAADASGITSLHAASSEGAIASAPANAPKTATKYYAPLGMMESAPESGARARGAAPSSAASEIADPPVSARTARTTDVPAVPQPPLPSTGASYPPISLPPGAAAVPSEADVLARPTFATPPVAPLDGYGSALVGTNPEIQEIPQAVSPTANSPIDQLPAKMVASAPPTSNAIPDVEDLHAYMSYDTSAVGGNGPDMSAVETEEVCPLGMEMREGRRRLKTGETAGGLIILRVEKNSAAERAGLRPYKRAGHTVLEGIAIGAAMIFPPAILAVPVIDYTQVGESYDMIIGVDGARVSNVLDFEDHVRNIQPGETVYFSVARNGRRIQIPVQVPEFSTAASP